MEDPPKDNPLLRPVGFPSRDEKIPEELRLYLGSAAFSVKKVTDTPTDALSVVNRKYVNLNGTLASRPGPSVASLGQHYFATDTSIPMVFNGTNWVNGVGSVVASG